MYQWLGLLLSSTTALMPGLSLYAALCMSQSTAGNKRRPAGRLSHRYNQNGKNQGMAMTLTTITSKVKGTPMRTKSTNR